MFSNFSYILMALLNFVKKLFCENSKLLFLLMTLLQTRDSISNFGRSFLRTVDAFTSFDQNLCRGRKYSRGNTEFF